MSNQRDGQTPLLRVENISKYFGEVKAIDNVSFDFFEDEVLAIIGGNAAGKTTLIKVISGIYPPTSGRIYLHGKEVLLENPRDARDRGISTVHQKMEEILVSHHDVVTNVFMGEELEKPLFPSLLPWLRVLNHKRMENETINVIRRTKVNIDSVERPIASYSGGQRQAIAISKEIRRQPKLLILDEPTAALGVQETRQTLALIKQLGQQGVPIMIISHNMEEVLGVATRALVLRNGKKVGDLPIEKAEREKLVALMAGTGEYLEEK